MDIQLCHVSKLLADKGYQLEVSEAAREYLAEVGYDPDFGARPLKRATQRGLQDELAMKILSGDFREGDVIQVDRDEEGLVFSTVVQGEVVEAYNKQELGDIVSEFLLKWLVVLTFPSL